VKGEKSRKGMIQELRKRPERDRRRRNENEEGGFKTSDYDRNEVVSVKVQEFCKVADILSALHSRAPLKSH
jgi:hypothetical protein